MAIMMNRGGPLGIQNPKMTPLNAQPGTYQTMQPGMVQTTAMPPMPAGDRPPSPYQSTAPLPQSYPSGMAVPRTGLVGAEQAIQGGLSGALGILSGYTPTSPTSVSFGAGAGSFQAPGMKEAMEKGVSALQGFVSPGQQAQSVQAALSGAMGAEAQRQAFQQFTESPGQAYLREQGEQAVLRNAAATGGLGSGRVLQELQRQGMGLAAQDLDAQFGRLGQVTGTGLQAAGQVGQLRGQEASLLNQMGIARGQAETQANIAGAQIAGNLQAQSDALRAQAAADAARMTYGAGEFLAGGRTRAGEQIAGNIGQTSGSLQQLLAQQGAGLADITGQAGGNLAGLLTAYAQAQATGQSDLAALLANIATGSASQRVGLPALPGVQQTQGMAGGIGSLLGGISTAYTAFSDARLKQDIQKVGEVNGINVYTWRWTPEALDIVGDQPEFGVIAQEVAETKPEAVTVGGDGFLRVDYGRVFAWQ